MGEGRTDGNSTLAWEPGEMVMPLRAVGKWRKWELEEGQGPCSQAGLVGIYSPFKIQLQETLPRHLRGAARVILQNLMLPPMLCCDRPSLFLGQEEAKACTCPGDDTACRTQGRHLRGGGGNDRAPRARGS